VTRLLDFLQKVTESWLLLWETLRAIPRLSRHRDRLRHELLSIGTRSALFIMATSAFMGVISIFQTASQLNRMIPELSLLGAGFIQVSTKEMVPLLVGLMVCARVGSAIASEVSSMVVTEQMDALRLADTDPVEYIVAPKVLASVVATPILGLMGLAVTIAAGTLVGWHFFDIHPQTFLNFRYTRTDHFVFFLVKLVTFGTILPLTASIEGFVAGRQGAFSVGRAATRGVIFSSFGVILADLVLSSVEYGIWG
jgi:phospholipid/cholesterol/gamma-HCH transport system permease protein